MQERLDWIDAVKGTCLILVVIAHLWRPCPQWVHLLTGGYMQVFFIMAGLTSSVSAKTFRNQVAQKSIRLVLPYCFYGIILLLLGAILPKHMDLGNGLLGLLYGRYTLFPPSIEPNISLLKACGYLSPLWFLPCIYVSYILLAWYDRARYPEMIVAMAVIVGIISPLFPILMPWSIEMSCVGFLLMLLGRALRPILLNSSEQGKHELWGQIVLVIGCMGIYIAAWLLDGPVNMSISQMGNTKIFFPLQVVFFCLLGGSEAIVLSILFKAIQTSIITRSVAYIGRQALRLLCIHLFIGEAVYYLFAGRDVPMVVTFACALAVILLINYVLDRLPWKKVLG